MIFTSACAVIELRIRSIDHRAWLYSVGGCCLFSTSHQMMSDGRRCNGEHDARHLQYGKDLRPPRYALLLYESYMSSSNLHMAIVESGTVMTVMTPLMVMVMVV